MPSVDPSECETLPDFVIIGAMKAGTSSVRHLLNSHPDVFIPDVEIFFFDLDELECHPDFAVGPNDTWMEWDFDAHFDRYLDWYRTFFDDANDEALLGEDSTTYATSKLAPERIHRVLDEPKLIHMLRHPVDRTYSQYWHFLRKGRATETFEQALRSAPHKYLKHGYYERNLRRYLSFFDRSQIKCVVFERFVEHTQGVVDEICEFLNLPASVEVGAVDTHRNSARIPKSPGLKRFLNGIDPTRTTFRYTSHLPGREGSPSPPPLLRRARRTFHRVLDRIAMLGANDSYPPMDANTRDVLTATFQRHNPNLSSLVGRDLSEWWDGW